MPDDIDVLIAKARKSRENWHWPDSALGLVESLAAALSAARAEITVLRGPDSDERDALIVDPILHRLNTAQAVIKEAKSHEWSAFGDSETHRILSKFPSGETETKE